MIKETMQKMRVDYKPTKKDILDLVVLIVLFLMAARLEVIL